MASAARRAGRTATLLASLALALAGCKAMWAPVAPGPAVTAAPPAVAVAPPPVPARKPKLPALASLPPPRVEEEDKSGFARLHGLDQSGTQALLGEPQQRMEVPPAILWRYASRDCDLDVYFYLDLESRAMRVLHYEVRDHDNHDERTERNQQKCYQQLVARRGTDPRGSPHRSR